MSNTTTEKYLYPPNFQGLSDFQADDGTITRGSQEYCINFTTVSDGIDESDVVKIDLSECRLSDRSEAIRMVVDRIDYVVSGYTSIALEWDRAPNESITTIPCGGSADTSQGKIYGPFTDPSDGKNDGTGDLILSTAGASAGDTYNLTIWFKVKSHK